MTEMFDSFKTIKNLALEEILKHYFEHSHIEETLDGLGSFDVYSCKKCQSYVPLYECADHYLAHLVQSNGKAKL